MSEVHQLQRLKKRRLSLRPSLNMHAPELTLQLLIDDLHPCAKTSSHPGLKPQTLLLTTIEQSMPDKGSTIPWTGIQGWSADA